MLERLGAISPQKQRLLLLIGCVILFGVWMCRVPLIEPDEVRYAEATREMFESRNFIMPYYNYEHRYEKPIFYYWVQSASRFVFGPSEWALRLPSAIIGFALILLVHTMLLAVLSRWAQDKDEHWRRAVKGAAFLGAAAMATLPLFAIWTRTALTDITLTAFITLAMLALLMAVLDGERARRWYLLAAVGCGFAMLTKGPIGLAIPGLVWLLYHAWERNLITEAKRVPWVLAVLVVLLINLPWYIAAGPEFCKQFFLVENLQRATGATAKAPMTLAQNLNDLLGFWAQILLIVFPYGASLVYEAFHPFGGNALLRTDVGFQRARRFSWVWIAVVVLIFSLSKTRFLNYTQSMSVAVIILFVIYLLGRLMPSPQQGMGVANRWSRRVEGIYFSLFGVVWVALIVWMLIGGRAKFLRYWAIPYHETTAQVLMALAVLIGLVFVTSVLVLRRRRREDLAVGWMMGGWSALFCLLVVGVVPLVFSSAFASVTTVGDYIRRMPREDYIMCVSKKHPEGIVYYGQRKVVFRTPGDATLTADVQQGLAQHPYIYVLVDTDGFPLVNRIGHVESTKEIGAFKILRMTRMTASNQ